MFVSSRYFEIWIACRRPFFPAGSVRAEHRTPKGVLILYRSQNYKHATPSECRQA